MGRTIMHVDVDAFYASVEQMDNPELRGKPVVVGGPPESRGVVAAASYEVRKFGVRSAMPMSRALRLCPTAVRVSPRFDRYGEISRQIMTIFRSVTPLVEPLSMDEAFLDVTGRHAEHGGAVGLARWLKAEVKERVGLTVSIGVGTNKTVAKIASDKDKPDGLCVVAPGTEIAFLDPLPVRALWGVGPKSEQALVAAGFRTVGDLAKASPDHLESAFGQRGRELWEMANGHDDRELVTEWERKSVSAENTFPRDLPDGPALREEMRQIAHGVAQRLRKSKAKARCIAIKLRYRNFRTITRQLTRPEPTDDAEEIAAAAGQLLDKTTQEGDMFRLLGIHASKLTDVEGEEVQIAMALEDEW
jgi:DNA polymerase IV